MQVSSNLSVKSGMLPWEFHLPESDSRASRVDNLIKHLSNKQNVEHVNALLLFCEVLQDRIPADDRYGQLTEIIALLKDTQEHGKINPYRGLAAFREKDARFFFGRETVTDQLQTAVSNRNLVAVIGPSGSGKSSIVFAGLLPRLRQQSDWEIVSFRPGRDPFQSLATAIAPILKPDADDEAELYTFVAGLPQVLSDQQVSLVELLTRATQSEAFQGRLLMVIDQFEELYTLSNAETRQRFLDVLLPTISPAASNETNHAPDSMANENSLPVTLLLTLRADFMGQASNDPAFADALDTRLRILRPMNRQELETAVVKPASLSGVEFEPGLAARILDDVSGHARQTNEAGELPLLEFALAKLWETSPFRLTHETYDEIGQARGALANHAEMIYASLLPDQQAQMQSLFIQLVQPGEGSEDTRRLATRDEIGDDLWRLTRWLAGAEARLVVVNRDETGQETVEIAHEALIHYWERLGLWMDENHDFRTWQEGLRAARDRWQASRRDEGDLLRGLSLANAESWLKKEVDRLQRWPSEIEFIQLSIQMRNQEEVEREAQRQKQLEQAQQVAEAAEARQATEAKSTKRLRIAAGILFLFFVAAVIAGLFAAYAGNDAQIKAVEARQSAATAEAETYMRSTAEAEAIVRKDEAQENLIKAQEQTILANEQTQLAEAQTQKADEQTQLAFSRQLASQAPAQLDANNILAVLLAVEAANPDRGNIDEIAAAAALHETLNASGHTSFILDHNTENKVNIVAWDSANLRILTTFCAEKDEDNNCIEGNARVWNAANGEVDENIFRHESLITHAIWGPRDDRILFITKDARLHVWDPITNERKTFKNCVQDEDDEDDETCYRILDASWSADGTKILTASKNNKAQIWDAQTGEDLSDGGFEHNNDVFVARWNWNQAEDRILTTSCQDSEGKCQGIVSIWDVGDPQGPILTLSFDSKVEQAAWSPDDTFVLTGHDNGVVSLLGGIESGDLVILGKLKIPTKRNPMEFSDKSIRAVSWSPDGSHFLAAGSSRVAVWNVVEVEEGIEYPLTSFDTKKGTALSVSWSHDGERILVGTLNAAQIWDAQTQSEFPEVTLIGHESWIYDVDWSDDDSQVVTAGGDGTARIWNVPGNEIPVFYHQERINNVALNDKASLLLTSSSDDSVKLWDMGSNTLQRTLLPEIWSIYNVSWSPDESLIAASGYYTTAIYSAQDTGGELVAGDILYSLPHENGDHFYHMLWNQDGSRLLTGGLAGNLDLWDMAQVVEGMYEPQHLSGHEGRINAMAWHPNQNLIVSVGADKTARLWDTEIGEELLELLHDTAVWYAAWNETGDTLLTATAGGKIRLWHISNNGDLVDEEGSYLTIDAHANVVIYATWNADESLILSTSVDDSARVWDAETGEERLRLIGHTDNVNWATWNQDESLILTASKDGTARIWDAKTGYEIAVLTGHTDSVEKAFWLPDESRIVTYSKDGTVRQYYMQLDKLISTACSQVPRNMTLQEWRRFIDSEAESPGVTCPNLPRNDS